MSKLWVVGVIKSSDSYTLGEHVDDLGVPVCLFCVLEGGGGCIGQASFWQRLGDRRAGLIEVCPGDDWHGVTPILEGYRKWMGRSECLRSSLR